MATDWAEPSPRRRTADDVYDLVHGHDGMTRSELAARLGLSQSAINTVVGRMVEDGTLVEVRAATKGPGSGSGRPGMVLQAVEPGVVVGGIDFGHNHVHVAVADGLGAILGEDRVAIDVDLRAEDAVVRAVELLRTVVARVGAGPVEGVVAGIPGPLDRATGLVRSPTILSSWVGRDPARDLAGRLGVPVHVENDAVLGAFGELRGGAGRPFRDFLYVKASHGIGASLVINGEPYRGATGLAGEVGHLVIPGRSEMCRCGDRGCLEAVVSVDSLAEQVRHSHPHADPAADPFAARDGVTDRILEEGGRVLGRVLASLCDLVNPEALVVGGELGATGSPFVDAVGAAIRRHGQPATVSTLDVRAATLGTRAEITGAVLMAAGLAVRERV